MVPFRGKTQLKPHQDWYLLGVQLKFPDEHPRPFYMGVPSAAILTVGSDECSVLIPSSSYGQTVDCDAILKMLVSLQDSLFS